MNKSNPLCKKCNHKRGRHTTQEFFTSGLYGVQKKIPRHSGKCREENCDCKGYRLG